MSCTILNPELSHPPTSFPSTSTSDKNDSIRSRNTDTPSFAPSVLLSNMSLSLNSNKSALLSSFSSSNTSESFSLQSESSFSFSSLFNILLFISLTIVILIIIGIIRIYKRIIVNRILHRENKYFIVS